MCSDPEFPGFVVRPKMKMLVADWKVLRGLAFYNGLIGATAGVRANLLFG
jgi:hypothetical protein